jgi:hypothetical protein
MILDLGPFAQDFNGESRSTTVCTSVIVFFGISCVQENSKLTVKSIAGNLIMQEAF